MNEFLDSLLGAADGRPTLMLSVLVFLATGTLAFVIMAAVHVRGSVKRRTADVLTFEGAEPTRDSRSLRQTSRKVAERLIEYTTKHYSGSDGGDNRQLRRRMIQAGFLDSKAIPIFFMARIACALVFGAVAFLGMARPDSLRITSALRGLGQNSQAIDQASQAHGLTASTVLLPRTD